MSVSLLTDQNFSSDGKVLALKSTGFHVVMFMTSSCPACHNFKPLFAKVAKSDNKLHFSLCDVGKYRSVVNMSRTTTTPISSVPLVLFYVNGRPFGKYKGPPNSQHLMNFIGTMLAKGSQGLQAQPQDITQLRSQHPQQPYQQQPPMYQSQPHPPQSQQLPHSPYMNDNESGIGSHQQDMQDDNNIVPSGIIPHNSPWYKTGYQNL